MNTKAYNELCELLDHPESLSVDKINVLISSSLKVFNEFVEVSKSGDEAKKEEALKQLLSFKEKLEDTAKKTLEKTGMNQEQLMAMINNPATFSAENQNLIKDIQQSLNEFNKEISASSESAPKKEANKKHRMSVKNRIIA